MRFDICECIELSCRLQFMSVWGTGEKGAEAWWSQGCRTLDDLRGRTDLTTQQVGRPCKHAKTLFWCAKL